MSLRASLLAASLVAFQWTGLAAQAPSLPVARTEVYAGSELETYLRNLQILGLVPRHPWSARRFTAAEVDRLLPQDTNHPWAGRYDWRPAPRGRVSVAPVRPEVAVRVNTGFPFGYNDGMVWAGRGVTVSGQAGFVARYGPIAAAIVPEGFWAQNARFPLQPNGQTGPLRFADANSGGIDHPQRFGDRPYAQASWGQSVVEVSGLGVVAGVSSANDYWGPAAEFPVILGNNAGGFPHVFAGSAAPLNVGIARVHVRSLAGKLGQSAYTAMRGDTATRAAAGAVVVVVPRWPHGLELAGTRFIHSVWAWRASTGRELLSPFGVGESNFGNVAVVDSFTNSLASVSFRWVLARARVEIYGEYGTEDYRYNLREVAVSPDHSAGYTLGLRQVRRASGGGFAVIRAEVQDLEIGTETQVVRGKPRFYEHRLAQGHTYLGQILGSEWGFDGAAASVGLDWYGPGGRKSVAWSRLQRGKSAAVAVALSPENPRSLDVLHTLGASVLFVRGRYEITGGATAMLEFNREYLHNAFNLNLYCAVRAGLP